MVVTFCSFTPFPPKKLLYRCGILINTCLIIIPFNVDFYLWCPPGLINGFLILITNRATKARGRRKENHRKFDGSWRGSKARKRYFYHFVMKPWLYSTGPLIYMLCLVQLTVLVFKSVEPLYIFFSKRFSISSNHQEKQWVNVGQSLAKKHVLSMQG